MESTLGPDSHRRRLETARSEVRPHLRRKCIEHLFEKRCCEIEKTRSISLRFVKFALVIYCLVILPRPYSTWEKVKDTVTQPFSAPIIHYSSYPKDIQLLPPPPSPPPPSLPPLFGHLSCIFGSVLAVALLTPSTPTYNPPPPHSFASTRWSRRPSSTTAWGYDDLRNDQKLSMN